MVNIWDAVGRFFGPAQNDEVLKLLRDLARIAVECAGHLTRTGGKDLGGIIAYEHDADEICDAIHELLDNSFIMRFDIADTMQLADEVDNVVDGMRKIATHINIYSKQLAELRTDALELMRIAESMVKNLAELIGMLNERRLSLPAVREIVRRLSEAESKADKVTAEAERRLVAEYSPKEANRLEFIAWDKLYELLERTTDHANHCGNLILSLARKEA